jgi:ASC-1-like (ASCH) protein
VNIPLTSDEKLKDGQAQFEIHITDNHSDSMKMARLIIPTKAAIPVPVFAWRTPDSIKAKN